MINETKYLSKVLTAKNKKQVDVFIICFLTEKEMRKKLSVINKFLFFQAQSAKLTALYWFYFINDRNTLKTARRIPFFKRQ